MKGVAEEERVVASAVEHRGSVLNEVSKIIFIIAVFFRTEKKIVKRAVEHKYILCMQKEDAPRTVQTVQPNEMPAR